jgi:hypothetical protein
MAKRAWLSIVLLGTASTGTTATRVEQPSSVYLKCRHDQSATEDDRVRRAQAVTLAKAINTAEAEMVRRTREYHPLANLNGLPAVPAGFKLSLYADRAGYMFAIKDTRDPCRFAVFSDSAGLLYEKSALSAPVIAQ